MSDDLDRVGPVAHIARFPLPWRIASDYTECGKPIVDVADRLTTVDEVQQRIKRVTVSQQVMQTVKEARCFPTRLMRACTSSTVVMRPARPSIRFPHSV